MALEGAQLNCRTSQALLAEGIEPDDLSETQHEEMVAKQQKAVGPGIQVMGIPLGTEAVQQQSVTEVM